MLSFKDFTGINNVLPNHQLSEKDLAVCTDTDIGLGGKLSRRAGYTELSALCHKNLWQGDGFMLATCNDDLVKTTGGTQTVLLPSLGSARVWYCNLPDGRTTFSNGLINGITDGVTVTTWGVPVPTSVGAVTDVAGALPPGDYQHHLTYVRLSDGLEGAPVYAPPAAIALGGLVLTGLPTRAGHKINVYLTSVFGGVGYLAGSTTTGAFSFTGTDSQLVLPCRTDAALPMPVGTVTALWRGRALVAVGPALFASSGADWEHCDMTRDFKQFSGNITLIQPVDDGVYVGTTKELCFLSGVEFDKLAYTQVVNGPVVLGSGVAVRGELVQQREGAGQGSAMVCIADGTVVAGFGGGSVVRLTEGRYKTAVTEVAATFRMVGRVPQYIAVPQ